MAAAILSRYCLDADRMEDCKALSGWRNRSGFLSMSPIALGGLGGMAGCTELAESVWEEMEASGENDGRVMLAWVVRLPPSSLR